MKITNNTTVQEMMEDWLYSHEIYNLKPSSFDRKEGTCKKQVFPYIGSLPIGRVTIDDIENLIQQLRIRGYSNSTIKKTYEAVNGCFRYYVLHRKIKINPASGVKISSRGQHIPPKVKHYSYQQLKTIEKECLRCRPDGKRVYPQGDLIPILAFTGIRIGELLALNWNDVDLVGRTIAINKCAVRLRCRNPDSSQSYKQVIQDSTKTSSSTRIVPLNQSAYDAFQRLKAQNGGKGLVAQSRYGKPLNNSNVRRTLRRVLANINYPKTLWLGIHALRHSFATILISNGADIKKVSDLLGHSSVTITYDYYVHFIPKDYSGTVELMDRE